MTVITPDGVVHRRPAARQGEVTTSCGLTNRTYDTAERVTCETCRDTDVCPKCGQRVDIEILRGRYRTLTTTKAHIIAKGSGFKVCHAILKEEGR